MKRVMIIGCGGSGKSTLARRLGALTGLPVVHLDQIYWSPGNWQHLSAEEYQVKMLEELEKPAWILDGNYNRNIPMRLERCDTVIYLDYNRFVCLFSWVKRVLTHWGKARPDMGPGCAEWLDPEFVRWVWSFNRTYRASYHEMLKDQPGKQIYIFKNRRQLKRFLETL